MQDRPAEAVQPGDLQCVAVAQQAEQVVELWAAALRAAGVVDVDVFAADARALQRVDLVIGALVSGRGASALSG